MTSTEHHQIPTTASGNFIIDTKGAISEEQFENLYLFLKEKFKGFEMDQMTKSNSRVTVLLNNTLVNEELNALSFYDEVLALFPKGTRFSSIEGLSFYAE